LSFSLFIAPIDTAATIIRASLIGIETSQKSRVVSSSTRLSLSQIPFPSSIVNDISMYDISSVTDQVNFYQVSKEQFTLQLSHRRQANYVINKANAGKRGIPLDPELCESCG
jgi:hypothetical protein